VVASWKTVTLVSSAGWLRGYSTSKISNGGPMNWPISSWPPLSITASIENQVVAFGYSNGANIAASLLLRRPGVLSAAILFRAMVPIIPDELPDLRGIRVWIGGGKEDTLIAPRQTEALAALLQQAGAEVTLRLFDAGHALTSIELPIAQRWLRAICPAA
jgi:predicted esterase